MPRYITKRNLTIAIGVVVALLIVWSASPLAFPAIGNLTPSPDSFDAMLSKTTLMEFLTRLTWL